MARFVSKAVAELGSYIESNLPTQLRAVETEEGIAVNSLTNPVDVVRARIPMDDRSPLVQVYDTSWEELQHRNHIIAVQCVIALSYLGTPDLEASELFCRRYMTAVRSTIMADATLNGTVVTAIPLGGSSAVAEGDRSATRFVYAYDVAVHVHSP